MFAGNFKSAAASLKLNKTRSLLTMMGVIIGICSVVTFVSLGEGLKHQLVGQINNLGSDVLTVRSGKFDSSGNNLSLLGFFSTSTLKNNDYTRLKAQPSLRAVAPFDFVTNNVSNGSASVGNVFVIGTSSDLPKVLRQQPHFGNFFSDSDVNSAVIGSEIARQLYREINPVGENIQINGQTFIINGVFKQTGSSVLSVAETDINSAVFIPLSAAQKLTGGNVNILQILAQAKPNQNIDKVAASMQKILHSQHGVDDVSVLKQSQLLAAASGMINTATHFISGIATISLLVGGIGIMDIMLASVSERTREIGIRKAVGATNRQILNQFLIEGLMLTVLGGAIGIVLSILIDLFLRFYTTWRPVMSWTMLIIAALFSMLVGVVFSAAPALKAARKNPIEALRD